MKPFLVVLGVFSAIGAASFFAVSQQTESAIHEIEGLIAGLGFLVCMAGVSITNAVEKLHPKPPAPPSPPSQA